MAKLTMQEEASAPSTPTTGKWVAYFKSGGLYIKDDAGTEIGPITTDHGSLSGLTDDDHPQYLLATGLREWNEQGSAPSTPASGKWKVYFKNDGLYIIDDAGNELGPLGTGSGGGGGNGWTAGTGTWSYVSADSPSFVCNVPDADAALFSVGARFSLTQTTEKFFIVTAKGSPSGGYTPCTIYGGTDYTLANSAITSPQWSNIKAPFGFPLAKSKWTVKATHSSNTTQSSPTANTWYNVTSISLPIGAWDVDYKCAAYAIRNSTAIEQFVTLSTANNTESDTELSCWILNQGATSTTLGVLNSLFVAKQITVAAKTSYYLNMKTSQSSVTSIAIRGDVIPTVIRAVCAYL